MSTVMFERGSWRIVHVEWNCHPETCCHDDHYPYCIEHRRFGQWWYYSTADDLTTARQEVIILADREKLDTILSSNL